MVIIAVGVFIPLLTLRAATTFTGCGGEYVPVQDAVKEAQVIELVNSFSFVELYFLLKFVYLLEEFEIIFSFKKKRKNT